MSKAKIRVLQADQYNEAVNCIVVMYRPGVGKYAAKVLSVDAAKNQMQYEILSGPRKGMRMKCEYAPGRPCKVYDQASAVKALLDG